MPLKRGVKLQDSGADDLTRVPPDRESGPWLLFDLAVKEGTPMIKPRILLVDDDVALTRFLRSFLEETRRYEIRTENDSRKVLGVAQAFRPDVVILDLLMPEMDGGELAVCLRTHPTLRNVRIVFLTAIISKDLLGPNGTTIGQHQILAKPVDATELVECIDRELTKAA